MILGYAAILMTLLLWSGFFISLKGGAISILQPADIALVRFLIPSLILLPFVIKNKKAFRVVPKRYLAGVVIGSGLPYFLIVGTAMHYAPVAHGSALVPGTLPLFVSAIAVLCYKQSLSSQRLVGLSTVLLGIFVFLLSNIDAEHNWSQLQGHSLFLTGSILWAIFTISARVANLNAHVCAGFVAITSLLLLIVAAGFGWIDSHLAVTPLKYWPWDELFAHAMLQGIGAGLIASFTYIYAIRIIGAEASAAFGSLTPVVATLFAIPIFGEQPDSLTWLALMLVTCGSIVASQIFMKNKGGQTYRPPIHR
ncbi:EamA-like transporter family protein [Vibrio sp. ES.051]|uniref:DMT family transporter n=1 Tax=Vibrio sp. ES.051 TaxID=1761909 RepID=UPI000C017D63|nr:DMT family transporter [Vibrio sp. ES.051]PFG57827.1 EamA-like transporter family protein [Vibrio sp. ES.051]